VRVELKSIGADSTGDWSELVLKGKGGLAITTISGATSQAKEVTLTKDPEAPAVTYKPKNGVFTLGERSFSGKLVVESGRLVNHVTLENYTLGVLRGELPLAEVPEAAAGALAIAIRSYTLHYLLQDKPIADLDDTTLYQVYAGLRYAPDDDNLRKGVNATRGRYLVWANAPLKAYYHSTCGGHTTDVPTGLNRDPIGCMSGVPCNWCRISKYYRWEVTIPAEFIRRKLRMDGNLKSVEVTNLGAGSRAAYVTIKTEGGKLHVPASEFRLRLGGSRVRSTRWTDLNLGAGTLSITGNGWGHGVGMCQMGALGRAQNGVAAEDIVLAYYAGATIERAY